MAPGRSGSGTSRTGWMRLTYRQPSVVPGRTCRRRRRAVLPAPPLVPCLSITSFSHAHPLRQVMRNKQTGQSEGYGFVEFTAHDAAERAIATLNGALLPQLLMPAAGVCHRQSARTHCSSVFHAAGTPMPSSQQSFRINWASFGIGARRPEGRAETTNEYSIFVGDLAPEVNDLSLFETFKAQYPSVRPRRYTSEATVHDPGHASGLSVA